MRQSTFLLYGLGLIFAVLVPVVVMNGDSFTDSTRHGDKIADGSGEKNQRNAPVIYPQDVVPTAFDVTTPDIKALPWHDPSEMAALIPAPVNMGFQWHIYKTEWSEQDELGYIAFVTAIGRASCFSIDECLRDPANPYRNLEDDFIWLGDCADMVYTLRGYYAWKNGLPFAYQNRMNTADNAKEDLRYSKAGNVIIGRKSATTSPSGKPVNAYDFLSAMRGEVSTAMFRTHPQTGARGGYDDFYPVAIDRNYILPGSVAYDIYGHVGMVYEVEDDGRILIVASHPDHSVARSFYGPNFMRSGPEKGSGLKAWRPIKLTGAKKTANGTYIGGKIIAASNDELPGWSLEQYYGTIDREHPDWQTADFVFDGRHLNYFDYVRRKLSLPGLPINPLSEMRDAMRSLCSDTKARRIAVNLALQNKIPTKAHPQRLPPNIYGTYGLWEDYSTPSRDARLKTSFVDLRRVVEDLVTGYQRGDEEIVYEGQNLPYDMLVVYNDEATACKISYKRMDDTYVVMDLGHINTRLFDLSFDPYHCPERRWGARGEELATCEETQEKVAWYEAQKYIRYQVDRTYDQFTGFSLTELQAPDQAPPEKGGIGASIPPNVDIRGYLIAEMKKSGDVLASGELDQIDAAGGQ